MKLKKISFAKFALYAYFTLSPLYIFPSGTPQPSDLIIAVTLFPWAFSSLSQLPKHLRTIITPVFFFVIWACITTSVNFYIAGDLKMLVYPAFYAFGLATLVSVAIFSSSCSQQRFLGLIQNLCLTASIAALFGYFATWHPSYLLSFYRHPGSFNNPNQMAYFGLLLTCITGISACKTNRWNTKTLFTLIASSLITLLSYSLSAVLAIAISLTGIIYQVLLSSQVRLSVKYFLITMSLFFYLGLPVILNSDIPKVSAVIHNWNVRSERTDSKTENILQERAYQRIIDYPHYLVFGAGEGGRDRFKSVWKDKEQEIHSTFGTILFSYGGVGFFLFCLYFKRSMFRAPISMWIIIMGPLVYGITHQGSRQPLFWLLFLIVAMATSKIKNKNDLYMFSK